MTEVPRKKPAKFSTLDQGDWDVMHAAATGEGLIKLTPDMLDEICRAAEATMSAFETLASTILTPERCAEVRRLRTEEGLSWRAIARHCYDAWQGSWEPPSNQIMGMALCEAAAEHFGEDYMMEPWN